MIYSLNNYSFALSRSDRTTFKFSEPEKINPNSSSNTNLPATTGENESPIGIGKLLTNSIDSCNSLTGS